MNLSRIICWFLNHKWQVFEGKRHCTCCGYEPDDEGVNFCPKCGNEREASRLLELILHYMDKKWTYKSQLRLFRRSRH